MLWIAFRFYIFVLRTQHSEAIKAKHNGCELLSDFISLSFGHNSENPINTRTLLWIAFRFYIFVLRTQQLALHEPSSPSCELLSDFISLSFGHNNCAMGSFWTYVVNCFQILYLCPSDTTSENPINTRVLLWIAFRFYIFVLRTQQGYRLAFATNCCELLSDFISLSFGHNMIVMSPIIWEVVNCFQILYLCPSDTTEFVQDKETQQLTACVQR